MTETIIMYLPSVLLTIVGTVLSIFARRYVKKISVKKDVAKANEPLIAALKESNRQQSIIIENQNKLIEQLSRVRQRKNTEE